jgi:putative transposase
LLWKATGGRMNRARFKGAQVIGILKAVELGGNIRAACREHNITEQTYYRRRTKYGGMDVSEAKKLREPEQENAELKKMVAELSPDNRMLRALNSKNGEHWGPTPWSGGPR